MATEPNQAPLQRSERTVVMADIVESVRLMEQDEEGTVRRWRNLVASLIAEELPAHGGRLVKSLGDGLLLEFGAPSAAVRCAMAIQDRIRRDELEAAPSEQIKLRMGVHCGEIVVDEIDIYGDAINVTARLMALAGPGEIVISATVRDQIGHGFKATIEDLGERLLRNLNRSVRAFRVSSRVRNDVPAAGLAAQATGRPSIAVLPFRNLTGDPDQDYLGEGFVEDIISALSRVPEFFVISRLTTLQFKDRAHLPRDIGEALRVSYVLSGSVRKAGKRLRLTAELTDTRSGESLWIDRFDGSATDIFDFQARIANQIVRHIAPYVREIELRSARARRPENLEAYHLMLRGLDLMYSCSKDVFERSREFLDAAIRRDPSFAAPYGWCAKWHLFRVGQGWSTDRDADAIAANRCAEAALERDGTDQVALAVHGHIAAYLNKDFDAALARFDKALAINPSSALAWMFSAATYSYLDQGAEAVERALRAVSLTPYDPFLFYYDCVTGLAYLAAGDYRRAVLHARKSAQASRLFSAAHRVLAIALVLSGRVEEARPVAHHLREIEPELTVADFRKRFPASRKAMLDLFADALARAGLPQ